MQRRRFVALGTGAVASGLAGCFGTTPNPREDSPELEPREQGPREIDNNLDDSLAVTDESLVEENGQLTFSLVLENITRETVTADVMVTMLDGDGEPVSDQYTARAVAVDSGDQQRVSFDIEEEPGTAVSYRIQITAAESQSES